ncbi:hypothetical protein EXIGLDRAFT_841501 [Exidia glandulosa HHB12029]|uniref:DUF6533 domain-containing protein n=1 Tax=Exidia glandulosa HHB12029 TaxID=1314781 RepID=A0A165DV87_EXIGL|nr:hypothetical protein EXIGLDRAFT_841501 [Exidia glandulosa HHB12029]
MMPMLYPRACVRCPATCSSFSFAVVPPTFGAMSSPLISLLPPPGTDLRQYIADQVNLGNATRYTILVTYIIVLWDTVLVLPDEINKFWRAKRTWFRAAFLANHYMSIGAMTLMIIATSGLVPADVLTDEVCQAAMSTGVVVGALSVGAGLYLVLLKVWALWGYQKWVIIATTAAWCCSYAATFVMVIITIQGLKPHTFSAAPYGLKLCGINYKPDVMKGIWASPLICEVLVFIFTIWNAADRPRSADVSLSRALMRDGIAFFASLFSLHLLNLILTILSPATIAFIGSCLVWGVSNVLLTRLVLRQTPSVDDAPRIPLPLTITKLKSDAVLMEVVRQSHDEMTMPPLPTPRIDYEFTPLPHTPRSRPTTPRTPLPRSPPPPHIRPQELW